MTTDKASVFNQGPAATPQGFPFQAGDPLRQYTEPMAAALIPAIAVRAVMHDGIAAAVSKHSKFLEKPWERLANTGISGLKLSLGDLATALPEAQKLFEFHKKIYGVYEGVPYDANDGQSQGWAHDCIFHGIEEGARRFAQPLSRDQREELYADYRNFALFFGTPDRFVPYTVDDVDQYRKRMIATELVKTDVSGRLVRTIFDFHGLQAPLPFARFGQALTKMSIEPELLEQAGVEVKPWERAVSNSFDAAVRLTYGNTPRSIRERAVPMVFGARSAIRNIRSSQSGSTESTDIAA